MSDEIVAVLAAWVAQHGDRMWGPTAAAYLADCLPNQRPARVVLLRAAELGVPQTLRPLQAADAQLAAARLLDRLVTELVTPPEQARWAVEAWAIAVGCPLSLNSQPAATPPSIATATSAATAPDQPLPASSPRSGQVVLETVPPGAQVLVDGQATGEVTPAVLNLRPGRRWVGVALAGYQRREEPVAITGGERLRLPVWALAGLVGATVGDDPPAGWPRFMPWPPVADPALRYRVCPVDDMPQVLVPAGEFLLGSPAGEPRRFPAETPQRRVTLSAYWIDLHVVTNAQYQRFLEATAHRPSSDWPTWLADTGPRHPAVYINWFDATAYAQWAGRALPSEAQWEKAARGGTRTAYPWGNWADPSKANYATDRATRLSWSHENAVRQCQPVASLPPNSLGLYEVCGNVWEWCQDYWAPRWYQHLPGGDPVNTTPDPSRSLRGGAWDCHPRHCRVTHRIGQAPEVRPNHYSFRCVNPT